MTTAPEYRQNGTAVLAPTRNAAVPGRPRLDLIGATATPSPVLRRIPLPVTEPPFDDEVGLTAARPTAVPAQGRIVYLTGTAARPASSTPIAGAAETATDVLPAGSPELVADLSHGTPVEDFRVFASQEATVAEAPVRLHLVAPVARRVSPSTRGVRPARPSRPAVQPERPDPSDGFAPGPRVDVDSAATRSRLLGGTDDPDATSRVAVTPADDPRPLAAQVVQAVVEILAGARQLTQLTAWVDEEVYAAVAAAAPDGTATPAPSVRRTLPVRTRPEDRPMVRSVHVCRPGPGVAEVVARVQIGGRSCAVALRLEGWRGRWRCNALTVG